MTNQVTNELTVDLRLAQIEQQLKEMPYAGSPMKNLALAGNRCNQIDKALRKLKQDIIKQMMSTATQANLSI